MNVVLRPRLLLPIIKKNMKYYLLPVTVLIGIAVTLHQPHRPDRAVKTFDPEPTGIITGADQTDQYLNYLKDKRVAVLANPTTIIGKRHLVDSLLDLGINITKVFGPEHGFRGNAGAGERVSDEKDPATGLPIISLYGKKRKPSAEDLADVDVFLFDIQDVGCRFYTYINVLRDVMESCAEHGKEMLILDRPNPNGYLVDGPTHSRYAT
jgi:uncharacterized protein YbbC (DUF1343 family)